MTSVEIPDGFTVTEDGQLRRVRYIEYSDSDRRREEILKAAVVVMNTRGRDRFNPTAVSREAKCSVGTVYRYFPTKEDLIDAVLPRTESDRLRTLVARLRQLEDSTEFTDAEKWLRARTYLFAAE